MAVMVQPNFIPWGPGYGPGEKPVKMAASQEPV